MGFIDLLIAIRKMRPCAMLRVSLKQPRCYLFLHGRSVFHTSEECPREQKECSFPTLWIIYFCLCHHARQETSGLKRNVVQGCPYFHKKSVGSQFERLPKFPVIQLKFKVFNYAFFLLRRLAISFTIIFSYSSYLASFSSGCIFPGAGPAVLEKFYLSQFLISAPSGIWWDIIQEKS